MAQLNVSLPNDLQRYVDGCVSAEGLADPAAYLCGLNEREPEEIRDEIIAEILASDA